MLIEVFKSKIHRVRVTESDLNYIGSITVDEDLLEAAGMEPFERVQVVDIDNGARLETYTIARLRSALGADGVVQTVVKRGYRLAIDLVEC